MVLPIYVALEKIDPRLIDAARDLYSNTWRAFRKVVFPLSLPGVFAGSLLVFIPAAGDFVNAYYLGSAKTTMIGNVVQNQFLVQVDYPVAAALSFVFMAIVMVIVVDLRRASSAPRTSREGWPVSAPSGTVTSPGGRVGRAFGQPRGAGALLYLFLPIFVIVAFSFNQPKGRFNAVWERFTLENWLHPFADKALVDALLLSLEIALIAATIATILGTFVAIALVRYRFRGGSGVNFLLVLPLTAPEIVLGASLLTLFLEPHLVLFNINFKLGFTTILIAHIMFCVSYVALTVKARLRGFDWTLEDAAMDLGANPTRTFLRVTLPLIIPGILAAFLLSFALSIDDFIITYFVSGPSTTTFPVRIFGQSRTATPPQINVLASMILFGSIIVLAVGTLLGQRRERRLNKAT